MAGAQMPGPALGISDPEKPIRVATFRHADLASSVDGAEPGVALGRVLEGPLVKVESAHRASVDHRAQRERMEADGFSQNETARRAAISSAHLSLIMNGKHTPSGRVLRDLHEVLFRPKAAELVMPAEVKVMGAPRSA